MQHRYYSKFNKIVKGTIIYWIFIEPPKLSLTIYITLYVVPFPIIPRNTSQIKIFILYQTIPVIQIGLISYINGSFRYKAMGFNRFRFRSLRSKLSIVCSRKFYSGATESQRFTQNVRKVHEN